MWQSEKFFERFQYFDLLANKFSEKRKTFSKNWITSNLVEITKIENATFP